MQRCYAAELSYPEAIGTKVFFDIKMGEEEAGRIVMGLYSEDVPKTAEVSLLRHGGLYCKPSTLLCAVLSCSASWQL